MRGVCLRSPLTPALSPSEGEREERAAAIRLPSVNSRPTAPPSPLVGRGERGGVRGVCLGSPLTPALSPAEGERENRRQQDGMRASDNAARPIRDQTGQPFSLSQGRGPG